MDKLDAMNAFARVVSTGSYAEAARRLGLTRSAVSKAVTELEQVLGARLLDRTTRRVTPTEAGRAYFERVQGILATVEETEEAVARLHDVPKGLLKINAPMSFGVLYLAAAVAEFMVAYPELKIELQLNDRFIDPIEEGVDVTVRIGALANSSLIARRLAPARRVLAAAPGYLERYGTPQTPDDLAQHRALSFGHSSAAQRWELSHGGETVTITVASLPVLEQRRRAAHRGARRQRHRLSADLPDRRRSQGRQAEDRAAGLSADRAWHLCGLCANRFLAAKTRLFIDFLSARFGPRPAWDEF